MNWIGRICIRLVFFFFFNQSHENTSQVCIPGYGGSRESNCDKGGEIINAMQHGV